ncbi:MAG: glycosyltransferase [Candidatus Dadabacteria bacterium]|nr:glycosyltransferase [Candidatus Dadabacteria bacterium]
MNILNTPTITVVIPTKNRGEIICSTLESLFANNYKDFNIIVVDQSTDDSTNKAVSKYLKNDNFTYIKSDSVGSATARNIAIEKSESEFIAITDDDCVVSVNWLENIIKVFNTDDNIGIVFGKVDRGETGDKEGFIPSYIMETPYITKSIYDKHSLEGLTACMGIRKSVWTRLNGFDCMLGPGALFVAEETDLSIRALLINFYVYYTPAVSVVHNGYRDKSEGRKLAQAYGFGNGGLFAKHIKCGNYGMLYVLLRQVFRWAFGKPWVMSEADTETYKLARMSSFIKGSYRGFVTPIDKNKGHFENTL